MNDQAQDRVAYSYDDIFPERFLHAPDLDGRTVTLVITDAWGEYVQNPKQKRKKERGDLCGILAFKGTKREYAMSKQNAWIIKTLWGKDPSAYVGKRITLSPVPDSSGFTEHGTRILFVGSPDIDGDRALTLPGGQALTFKKTVPNCQEVVEGAVDPVTGEVDEAPTKTLAADRFTGTDDAPQANEAASSTQQGQFGDAAPEGAPHASAPGTAPESPESDDDEGVPGRGPLFSADDPNRPATARDKKALSEAVAHVPTEATKAYRKRFGGRANSELTHGEIVAFTEWAVKQVLA